jgi:hypothetical protein
VANRVQTGKGDAHTRVNMKSYRAAQIWDIWEEKKKNGLTSDIPDAEDKLSESRQ